jgi:DNA-binding GntR family transcriptional regulator
MGINFRRVLICELERRRSEIDSSLEILRRLRERDGRAAQPSLAVSTGNTYKSRYEEIRDLRQQGLSLRAIAEQVSLSHAGVWKALRRLEQDPDAPPRSALDHHSTPVSCRSVSGLLK